MPAFPSTLTESFHPWLHRLRPRPYRRRHRSSRTRRRWPVRPRTRCHHPQPRHHLRPRHHRCHRPALRATSLCLRSPTAASPSPTRHRRRCLLRFSLPQRRCLLPPASTSRPPPHHHPRVPRRPQTSHHHPASPHHPASLHHPASPRRHRRSRHHRPTNRRRTPLLLTNRPPSARARMNHRPAHHRRQAGQTGPLRSRVRTFPTRSPRLHRRATSLTRRRHGRRSMRRRRHHRPSRAPWPADG